MENIIISNPEKFEEVKRKIAEAGLDKLHVISDFDQTLTTGFTKGEKVNTSFALIRNQGLLGEDYVKKAYALFDKYHPIEINTELSRQEKIPLMKEWWKSHLDLLKNSGFSKDIISLDNYEFRTRRCNFGTIKK